MRQGVPGYFDGAGVGRDRSEEHQKGGGLPGTIGSQQPEPTACGNGQIEMIDRDLTLESLDQAAGINNQGHDLAIVARCRPQ